MLKKKTIIKLKVKHYTNKSKSQTKQKKNTIKTAVSCKRLI